MTERNRLDGLSDQESTSGSAVCDAEAEFCAVLKDALTRRGLTLARAQVRLAERGAAVSVATLSKWQSGRSLPGRRIAPNVLTLLEQVLDLPTGILVKALERTREMHRREADAPPQAIDLHHRGRDVQAVFNELGVPFQDGFSRISVVETIWLTAEGLREKQRCEITLRADRDNLQSFGVCQLDPQEGATPSALPTFLATFGCEVNREVIDHDRMISFAEFRLFEPKMRGDLVTVGIEANYPPGVAPLTAFGRSYRTSFRDAALEVVFHEDKLPVRVEQFYEPADSSRIADEQIFSIADTYGQRPLLGHMAQSYFSHRGPGVAGLRWKWGDNDKESSTSAA